MNSSTLVGSRQEELDTPCLCIDLPLMEGNIAKMSAFFAGRPAVLRPHTKTHKSPVLARK
jgi:D-serine deaminase-like pyridoxal phosphate-dependent protein